MPSIRFSIGVVHLFIVCMIGWQAREKMPALALPMLALCWCSLSTDLLCFACYHTGVEFETLTHLYTIIEFSLETIFISRVTKNKLLKQILNFILPLFFIGWFSSQFTPQALQNDDTYPQIASDIIIIIGIVWTLTELAQELSTDMVSSSRSQFSYEIMRRTWQPVIGKLFVGLFIFNFVGLIIYAFQITVPGIEAGTYKYYHSGAHILKNTCFFFAFLQSIRS